MINVYFSNKKENLWYDDECREKKFYFLHMLDKYRSSKTDENRVNMVRARSNYKTLIRQRRIEFDRVKTNRFVSAKK